MKNLKRIIVMMIVGLSIIGCSPEDKIFNDNNNNNNEQTVVKYEKYTEIVEYNLTDGCVIQFMNEEFYCYFGYVKLKKVVYDVDTGVVIRVVNFDRRFSERSTPETAKLKAVANYNIGDHIQDDKPLVIYVRI